MTEIHPALPLHEPILPSKARPRVRWGGLYGSAGSLWLAEAARIASGPILLIVADTRQAGRMEEELRFFRRAGLCVETFPAWETLPYDLFSPHPDIVSQRLRLLSTLPQLTKGIVIVDIETLLQRLPPQSYIDAHAFDLKLGETFDPGAFRERLSRAGYTAAAQVMAPGEFAVRGSIIDLFPMGSTMPYRIDLFDEEIETIRVFDPETQRSDQQVQALRLLPAREFPLTASGIQSFKRRFRIRFPGDLTRMPVYRDIAEGAPPAGIEYYLPLFFDDTSTLLDHLPGNTLVAAETALDELAVPIFAEIEGRHAQRAHDAARPILRPDEVFMPPAECIRRLAAFRRIELSDAAPEVPEAPEASEASLPRQDFATRPPPNLRIDARREEPAQALIEFLSDFNGHVLIAAESAGRREMLLDILQQRNLRPVPVDDWSGFIAGQAPLAITVSALATGLVLSDPAIALIAEEQLFGERVRQERRRRRPERDPEKIIRDLSALLPGAPVVHEEYGVGRFIGLTTLEAGGLTSEYLVVEYAEGDKLYVPVQALDRVSRYSGAPAEAAPLHKLGGEAWEKAKRKAAQRIRDTAAELLDLYSRREARQGERLTANEAELRAFEAAFAFEETPDQAQAIAQVIADLGGSRPMDRVVCGDVGFGKTEVALRAAFIAVQAGKQVAVLVPTTLLAQQHYQSFADRFADWPVKVESLSRFRTARELEQCLQNLESGRADIVVGTHRLLQSNVKFKRLGLVIIDEEHRFGVKDKERMKQLRAQVDVLTLTATPIPRTLNMAMGGLRELSLITTPPVARLSIKTFVSQWDAATIREACLREIRRGGQIYFVHNSVETIEKTARSLAELVPEARIAIGHGQMRERELEQVMLDFYHQRCNLLVCTTIVESGIDVPTANTIIIDRADKFGLAQLHQLRGRVGRSHHQAYAYLMTPPHNLMTADAHKRLEAIESLEDLGAGFTLATHDLEIRGAGELLGEEQSGQIQEIGYALYMEMLERAVSALKEGKVPQLDQPMHQGPEVDLHVPALLPHDYLPDVHLRLVLYKRIAAAATAEELRELQVEMIDRFGLLPGAAKNLFRIAGFKQAARALGLRKIDIGPGGGSVTFEHETRVDPATLIRYVQQHARTHRLEGGVRLRFTLPLEKEEQRFALTETLLVELGKLPPAQQPAQTTDTQPAKSSRRGARR
ncbi:transcription-repair coupling factor [Steroidobacter denitrificans]|uniref:Transcription-repair-coupling factor n=1 Tax=Steroidobacter denitrificans TaxID=465721 RepID=A0A127FCH1_STEDE|nr:transcription-repair coupling factor [Steroidobacter denitrificans]AMN47289.1 transcription-repair coupling factor [Steroidobacter denitrificans]